MDKGVRVVAVLPKQWHGACNTFSSVKKNDLRVVPTGGVPTLPYQLDMYQHQKRSVANDVKNLSMLRKLQDHPLGTSGNRNDR
jgi:hypothetical protein